MLLVRNVSGHTLDVLMAVISDTTKQILFVEAAAGAKEPPSERARNLLMKLQPYSVEKRFLWQEEGYSNTGHFFECNQDSLGIVLQESVVPSDWVYPDLFDDLNFLRSNGHSILYCSGMTDEISLFLTTDELKKYSDQGLLNEVDVISFKDFLADKSNEFSDGFNWDIIVNYDLV